MIFASDLDRTLIYSKKFIEGPCLESEYILIESKKEKEISFITRNSLSLLKDICSLASFIPVTTRTLEQYSRVQFKKFGIVPEYAIVANGGIVLKNDHTDPVWDKHIKSCIEKNISLREAYTKFDFFLSSDLIEKTYICENLFFYAVLKEHIEIDTATLISLNDKCSSINYNLSIQGRKVYFIPTFLSKDNALSYVITQLNDNFVITSGDSNLDYPMLKESSFSILPKHHTIKDNIAELKGGVYITYSQGILAGEEILKETYKIIRRG